MPSVTRHDAPAFTLKLTLPTLVGEFTNGNLPSSSHTQSTPSPSVVPQLVPSPMAVSVPPITTIPAPARPSTIVQRPDRVLMTAQTLICGNTKPLSLSPTDCANKKYERENKESWTTLILTLRHHPHTTLLIAELLSGITRSHRLPL